MGELPGKYRSANLRFTMTSRDEPGLWIPEGSDRHRLPDSSETPIVLK